ncbi:MAG: hypothetical protein HY717_08580 [Planctomycetes bacterium]|nr:hypothetical protein [Planctomycetota bacterium]
MLHHPVISCRAVCWVLSLALGSPGLFGAEADGPETEAFAGEPFGVARIHFTIVEPAPVTARPPAFNLAGEHARILYPVFFEDPRPAGPEGPVGPPAGFAVLFLFRGAEPLKLTATTNLDQNPLREFKAAINPAGPAPAEGDSERRRRDELLAAWRRGYQALLEHWKNSDDHYPLIENYLLWRFAQVLGSGDRSLKGLAGRSPSLAARPLQGFPELERLADLLMGTESIRIAMQRDALLEDQEGKVESELAAPLPRPIEPPPVDLPAAPAGLEVEPISFYVPEECLYIRFPRYSALQSLRARLEGFGASLHDALLGRALDAQARERLEGQLALRETALGKLFGDLAIGETAFAAYDTFVREGSALGVIFEVKNEALFLAALKRLREEVRERSTSWPGGAAEVKDIEIGGRKVELLEAPGNRVRSFHVACGSYHLVANCRRLVERFLECAGDRQGKSLANNPGFRHARALHPLSQPEEALVFISDPFIRGLIGPAYRAEMTRRTRARAELELVEVARMTARAETGQELDLPALVERRYLPPRILSHADGSTYRDGPDGAVDTWRGARGTFLPIPDVPVDRLTSAEAEAYERFRWFYQQQWQRIDPAVIRVRMNSRRPGNGPEKSSENEATRLDHLALSIDILPYARLPYQWLSALAGLPAPRRLKPLDGEVLSVSLEGGSILANPPAYFRAALVDFEAPMVFEGDFLNAESLLKSARFHALLPVTRRLSDQEIQASLLAARRDESGWYRLSFDLNGKALWGKIEGQYLVVSFEKELAERAAAQLLFEEDVPAQARLELGALEGKRVARALAVQNYLRQRRISKSGAGFLSLIHRELKVPLESCDRAAERLLAQRVVCPAGGEYRGNPYPVGGEPFFRSSAFLTEERGFARLEERAEALFAPFLRTFRGLRVSLALDRQSLHSEVRIDLAPPAAEEPKK